MTRTKKPKKNLGQILKGIGLTVDKLVTGGAVSQVLGAITGDTSLTPENKEQLVKELDLVLKDIDSARDNETARDTSESAPWISKVIHEVIAIILLTAFVLSLWYAPVTGAVDMLERSVLMVLSYLYGKSVPDKSR